jgi:Carboxypeptidase regulatory-like domain/TonB-dependent Receptor Plug Domain/TonB dependent receptor
MDRRSLLRSISPITFPSSRSTPHTHLWKLAATTGVVALCGIVAMAQGIITGSIAGTAADPSGAVLPGAKITAKNTATNQTASTVAGEDGSFSLKDLPVGQYTLTISDTGFSTLTLNNVQVAASRTEALGIEKLHTGDTTTSVDVSAAQNIIETTQAQVTTTFDTQQLTNLPTGGGFDELALLIPGVVDTHADNFSNSNGANFSVNGQRGRANNFEIDGQANNDTTITGPQVFFGNDEAIAEVQVITNSFSAQYGRNAGSVVNYITKSGTNSFHGSAIYKYSGDFTSSLAQGSSKGTQFGFCGAGQTPQADGCSPAVVPRYVDNFYGGTLGGPIIKDKLFAFGSTYWDRETEFGALVTSGGQLFPTTAGLAQLVAALPNNPSVAILQQLNPYAVTAGNPRQIGPVTNETIPGVGSVPFAQFGRQVPFLSTDQEDLGRLDWQATPKDRLYLRYFYQTNPTAPDGATANGGFINVADSVHSVGVDETHIFGPRWVDQLRYSFQQSTLAFQGGGFPNCTITSFANCPSSVSQLTLPDGSTMSGIGLPSGDPQGRVVKVGQVQDNANWTAGHHAITFGGEFLYENAPNVFLPNSNGNFNFDTLNDFLGGGCGNGACSVGVASGSPSLPFKEKDFALYFQDDWKIAPTLTLNMGLRWEFFGQPINYLHSLSVAAQTGSHPFWSTALPLADTTLASVANYYKNFEPRLGFAWNPAFNTRLVVRGGYSINVDPEFQNIALNIAGSAPFVASGAIVCAAGSTNCIPTGGATFATVQTQLAPQLPTGGNPALAAVQSAPNNFRNPLGQTYTLGVQYQIRNSAVIELRYVGNHTSQQFQSLNANPYLATVAAAFPNVVNPASLCSAANSTLGGADVGFLNCGHTSVLQVGNTAFSQYQSLQTNLTTRNYHGITATFGYTWSHNIDNASEIYSTGAGGNTIAEAQNPLNTNIGERANSALDFPNAASISFTYKLPSFHTGNNLLNRLTDGWQANTIWIYNSGQPYTDFQNISNGSPEINPNDSRTAQSYSDIPFAQNFIGADVARPILSNPKAPAGTLGIYTTTGGGATGPALSAPELVDYASGAPINPSQVRFIANNQLAANILGNPYPGSTRNILRGDTFNNADVSVFKNTKITERVVFRLEVDAYNALNRGYYGAPGNNLTDYAASGGSYFNNFHESTASGASLVTPGTGLRNMLFSGKILF